MDNSNSNFLTGYHISGGMYGNSCYCRKLSSILLLILFSSIILPVQLFAQNFQLDDTITEYPHHGTIYANRFEGRRTSSGEIFRQTKFTAAHWSIKLGTYVLVTNPKTNLQVVVKVNDRCPKRGVFDLTRTAAHAIGIRGCQPVIIRILSQEEQVYWALHCESQDRTDHTKTATNSQIPTSNSDKANAANQANASNIPKTKVKTTTATNPDSLFYDIKLGDVQTLAQAREAIRKLPTPYQDLVEARPSSKCASIELILTISQHKKGATKVLNTVSNAFPKCELLEVKKN